MFRGKWLIAGFAGTLLSLLLGGVIFLTGWFVEDTNASSTPGEASFLPDFYLTGIDGETHALGEFSGRPAVVNFWATWCKPCEQEMPLLQAYAENYPEVVFVGVNSGEEADLVGPFLTKYDITFPVWLDSDEKLTDKLKIVGLPTTYFIDSKGEIKAIHLGQLTPDLIDQYLLRLGINL